MAPRTGLRMFQHARFARLFQRRPLGKRYQTTDVSAPQQSLGARIWKSPVGVKTVHFWAPVMKWALVLAGVSDFWRPAEKLSLTQNAALTATGAIWTRWCFVIRPKNMLLAAVNFFLGCVGVVQVTRIMMWQRSVQNKSATDVAKDDTKDLGNTAANAAKDAGSKAKETLN